MNKNRDFAYVTWSDVIGRSAKGLRLGESCAYQDQAEPVGGGRVAPTYLRKVRDSEVRKWVWIGLVIIG